MIDPDGSRAFVGCTAANYVAVLDLRTMRVTSHLDVGGGPDGLVGQATIDGTGGVLTMEGPAT